MISADLKFEGFDVRSWTNLVSLFSPAVVERMESAPLESDDPEASREGARDRVGTLVIVLDARERLLKCFHTSFGRVTDLEWRGDETLPELCDVYRAARAIVLREGVMDELMERLALRLKRDDDYVTQWLALARIARELQEAGLMRMYPRPLANVPVPTPNTVRRALDIFLPDDHALLVVLWDREHVWTSAALRRRRGSIDRVAGPDLISRWVGPLGGDFRRDHRVIVDAVSHSLAPVHLGLFTEARTLRTLLRDARSGRWAQAVAVRDIIFHPTPPYVAVALGADAVRGVASQTRKLLGGLDFLDAVSPITGLIRSRVAEVASVRETLGFDPLVALGAWLRRNEDGADSEAQGDAREDERDGL